MPPLDEELLAAEMPSVATELTDADRLARICHELQHWRSRSLDLTGAGGGGVSLVCGAIGGCSCRDSA